MRAEEELAERLLKVETVQRHDTELDDETLSELADRQYIRIKGEEIHAGELMHLLRGEGDQN